MAVAFKQFEQLSFADIEVYSVLPEHPIWSKVADLVDFSFTDRICAHLYSSRGPRPYAPSIKFKLHVVQRYYNLSDREMEERVIGDLFIKRFLGVPVSFMGFDHSTIGLDRDRLGSALFDACHHHILAQAKQKGLWGDNKDIWIVDSFITQGNAVYRSSYRLIKHAFVRVLNHLKRAYRHLFDRAQTELDLRPLTTKLPPDATAEDLGVAFSQLILMAYELLHWFEKDAIRNLFWSWSHPERRVDSLELQAIMYQTLMENVYPEDPNDPKTPFKKIERKKRLKDRIGSAVDPEKRNGFKSKTLQFFGDKVQVVMSETNGIVLHAEPIAGNEPDGDRLQELLNVVMEEHNVKPEYVLGDSAYGYGVHRQTLAKDGIQLVSPLKSIGVNTKGLMSSDLFLYDPDAASVTCPQGQVNAYINDMREDAGKQYIFSKAQCKSCPIRSECTTSKRTGRTIFISDYYAEFKQAGAFNATDAGKALLQKRANIERKCNEMKNHNGLGRTRLRSREKRRIDTKLVAVVTNLKQIVKHAQGSLTLSFQRKRGPGSLWPIYG
ncbi:transposase [Paenibacillus sp. strain BS8-2]